MDRRGFLAGCCCGALPGCLTGALAAEGQAWVAPPRLVRPESGTDEGGLWAFVDREETKLRRSRFVLRDRPLNEYLTGIACRLAGDHCPDLRVYVVRTPVFNASMAPNGMLQIWTGLLLRMANEAQLAAVIGHEIGHYLARHSLDRLRDAKSRSAFGQFLGIALAAAGAGGAGSLAQLAVVASAFAYGRDHEREADRIGQELMARAGYDPGEAPRVWSQLLAEIKAEADWVGELERRSVLFASHPHPEERMETLGERATELRRDGMGTGTEPWRRACGPYRKTLLEDELRRRRSGETLALLDRMIAAEPTDPELHYFRGEAYRQRGADGDNARALDAYAAAETFPAAPAELHRGRGMILQATGDEPGASQAFAAYVRLRPDAEDAALFQRYVNR
ncbi:MAG: M48 family metalloprotease [Rhodocyclaceae bacterium]|nr:M48 family metalloprotease [Rhodocyclaceae bacterium]